MIKNIKYFDEEIVFLFISKNRDANCIVGEKSILTWLNDSLFIFKNNKQEDIDGKVKEIKDNGLNIKLLKVEKDDVEYIKNYAIKNDNCYGFIVVDEIDKSVNSYNNYSPFLYIDEFSFQYSMRNFNEGSNFICEMPDGNKINVKDVFYPKFRGEFNNIYNLNQQIKSKIVKVNYGEEVITYKNNTFEDIIKKLNALKRTNFTLIPSFNISIEFNDWKVNNFNKSDFSL